MPDFDPQRDLGRDDIPVPFAESTTDGVQATFDPHGRLVRLVTLRDGVVSGHEIVVDPDRGAATHAQVKAHLDAGDPTALRDFVQAAVGELARSLADSPVHCAFCMRTRGQVGAMLAGQSCCICDECVKVCSDALAGD